MSTARDRVQAWALDGIPEVDAGHDLLEVILGAIEAAAPEDRPLDGDVLVVTSKIVSKAEGRTIAASDREEAITAETVRVVATRSHPGGITRIVENRLGVVAAAAGVDASNVADGTVLLLPLDPDASARVLCAGLRERLGVRVGVVVSDTLGRPWRVGQTDAAIGAAGLRVVDDLRGTTDSLGRPLGVTMAAVADEIAALGDLVKGKTSGRPVAVVRGVGRYVDDLDAPGARSLVRTGPEDMFRLGTDEALAEGWEAGFAAGHAAGVTAAVRGADGTGRDHSAPAGTPAPPRP